MTAKGIYRSKTLVYDGLTSVLRTDGREPSASYEDRAALGQELRSEMIKARAESLSERRTIEYLTLVPTDKCLGRCTYCYNEQANNAGTSLTVESVLNQVDEISKTNELDVKTVRVYGGEPLLFAKNTIDILIALKERLGDFSVYISSGLLFDSATFNTALFELLRAKRAGIDVSVGTTVDFGIPSEHYTRIGPFGNMKDAILSRAEEIGAAGVPCAISSIVTKDTIPSLLISEITEHASKHAGNVDMATGKRRKHAYRISVSNDDKTHPSLSQVKEIETLLEASYATSPVTSNVFPYTDVINGADVISIGDDKHMLVYPPSHCGIFSNMRSIHPTGTFGCHTLLGEDGAKDDTVKNILLKDERCASCDLALACRGACPTRKMFAPEANDTYCAWIKASFRLALIRLEREMEETGATIEDFEKVLI